VTSTSLQGKTAVVTGASRGLGRRIAQALAAHGANVALLARPSADLQAAARDIGERAIAIECDVSDPDSVRTAFATCARKLGRLDILINNAGISELHKIEHATDASIRSEIAINLAGPIFCCREAIPLLRASGSADIINISSESVRAPFPFLSVYSATKGGLETFSAGLRAELLLEGIRVTVLRAGHVGESNISQHWSAETSAEWEKALKASGHHASTGAPVSPLTMADALINILLLPREVNVELMDIRSNLRLDADQPARTAIGKT
jgi:meso-butanediol dehydrogenase / (S,S)-butanediol dehydrogenase / diacetyl reductase